MKAVISLSGGMDSTCLLIRLLSMGYSVHAISFNYGQNHIIELKRLQKNLNYLRKNGYFVAWDLVDLTSLSVLLESGLISGDIPEGHYEEENMKNTVVPNRNAIFSSIAYGHALSVSKRFGQPVKLALGVHSGDHAIYPDCRPEFYAAIENAFKVGNWDSDRVEFYLPYLHGNKTTILQDCLKSSYQLGLGFDTILANTNTSYNPDAQGRSSGKSGADIERIEAFININRKDPVPYVKPWEEIKEHALTVLNKS